VLNTILASANLAFVLFKAKKVNVFFRLSSSYETFNFWFVFFRNIAFKQD